MKNIHVTRQQIDFKQFRRSAVEQDCDILINEDVLIYLDGQPIIAYIDLTGKVDTDALRWACQTTKYAKSQRTAGLPTISRTFGYLPRRVLLADFCHRSSVKDIGEKQNLVFENFGKEIEQFYREYFPEVLQTHYNIVNEKILPEWRIEGSPFTSGIVNKNNELPYHRDAGNFKGVFSNMVAFKKNVHGGRLCVPEFGLKFEIADNTLLIFDGQKFMHGVTPIIKTAPDAYRYTVVYYSLEQLWKCLPIAQEIDRIRTIKAKRERKRIGA